MGKRNKHIKMFHSFLNENKYYDRILDIYLEKGEKGMSPDEISYLKSGGTTELPKRFQIEIHQKEYDDYMTGLVPVKLSTEIWEDIFKLKKIIKELDYIPKFIDCFDGMGHGFDLLCCIVFKYDRRLMDQLKYIEKVGPRFGYSGELDRIYRELPPNSNSDISNVDINGEDNLIYFVIAKAMVNELSSY